MRAGFCLVICISGLVACTSVNKSVIWTAESFLVSDTMQFLIRPVSDRSGMHVSPELLSFLTASLEKQFAHHGLRLVDDSKAVIKNLIVRPEILAYKFQYFSGPPPPSRNIVGLCILRTQIFMAGSSELAAEVVTINQIDVGRGLLEPTRPEALLERVAKSVAKEIANL